MTIKRGPEKIRSSMFMLALPIFPASHPASIVGADELNFCVRDGNRWTLIAINTNFVRWPSSHPLCQSAPRSNSFFFRKPGDPYRIRTDVKGVRGLCLNHLTNGPFALSIKNSFRCILSGPPSGIRTRDPLIKSQLLYQLS